MKDLTQINVFEGPVLLASCYGFYLIQTPPMYLVLFESSGIDFEISNQAVCINEKNIIKLHKYCSLGLEMYATNEAEDMIAFIEENIFKAESN